MTRNFLLVALILTTLLLLFQDRLAYINSKNFQFNTEKIPILRKDIAQLMKNIGPDKTFDKFKKQMQSQPLTRTHVPAHVFGEVLYQQYGIGGIGYCDESFGFGCFHGFFIKTVSDKGIGIVNNLDDACIARFGLQGLGCQHGIGHGIGEFYGQDHLDKQLETCSQLSWKGTYHGCRSGVFMEYNFATVVTGDGATTQVRDFDADHPYDPCLTVGDSSQTACVYELPSWWWEVLDGDIEKMGNLCGKLTVSQQEPCFIGIGEVIATRSDFNRGAVFSGCKLMPAGRGELVCRAGSAWAFFAEPQMRERADSVCEGASECKELYQRVASGIDS